jgi:ABC-2 type transport system permease protein
MMATPTREAAAPAAEGALTEVIRVAVPERGLRQDVRAASIVWRRELIRFRTDRLRAITSLIQPVLFLFILGTGLGSLANRGLPSGISFKTFIYPGVLAMAVLFTAIFSAGSIVWDREFGFLREMLVAPVNRGAIVLGKCLGGATVATFQGIVVLILAGLAGVPYSPVLILTLIGELLLLSFTLTAFGVMMAARITQFQAFMALTQMLVMPLFFLSGALYPLNGLPAWLTVLTRVDPLTYIVDPMRRAVFSHLNIGPLAQHVLAPGVSWFGWVVPTGLSLGIVAVMGIAMAGIAMMEFNKTELSVPEAGAGPELGRDVRREARSAKALPGTLWPIPAAGQGRA